MDRSGLLRLRAAAHSLEKNVRRENTDSLYDYLAGKTLKAEYKLTPTDVRTEYIMLRLRTEKGINLLDYGLRFGVPLLAEKEKEIKKLLSAKVIEINGNILKATDKGFYLQFRHNGAFMNNKQSELSNKIDKTQRLETEKDKLKRIKAKRETDAFKRKYFEYYDDVKISYREDW